MRFAFLWTGVLLGSLAGLLGCSAQDASPDTPTTTGTDKNTTTSIDAALSFEDAPSIDLAPGEVREVTVMVSPPAAYDVYFALRSAPNDAYLDASLVTAGDDGRASVKLHAPGSASSFSLRAFINNGPTAELPVTVSKQGVGGVEVVPQYDGPRDVTQWIASVIIGTTCDSLAGQLPGDVKGALIATAPLMQDPIIQSVPVGPKLAITVRAGHFAWGCADAHNITAGVTTKVKIHVVDVPVALDQTSLDVALDYAPDAAAYTPIVDGARATFLDAFFPAGSKESALLLLDTMASLAPDPAAFAKERDAAGWDTLAATHFQSLPAPLRSRMDEWLDLGLGASTPQITGHLSAIPGVQGEALFQVTELGGIDAAAAGVPADHVVQWSSQPGDKVLLNGTLYWLPSRFVGAACVSGAAMDLGFKGTMADALAQVTECGDLAAKLGQAGACDAMCLADLCRSALDQRWQNARDASAASGTVGTVDIGATGQLVVDDTAVPLSLAGSWLGKVSDGGATASCSGNVTGVHTKDAGMNPNPGDPPQ
jgi:hypothetical protein